MVVEFAVRDGDCGGAFNDVNEAISGFREGNMVNPNMVGAIHSNCISVALGAQSHMLHRVPNQATTPGNNVVNPNVVDDNIVNKLNCNACAVRNPDLHSPTINCFITGHN